MKPFMTIPSHLTSDRSVQYQSITNQTSAIREKRQIKVQDNFRISYRWLLWHPRILRALGYASVIVVPSILAIWLPFSTTRLQHADLFKGSAIGGTLTLTQAKAVDFITGAVIVPLSLALLNYIWFTNARSSMIDNGKCSQHQGVPLYALLEASGTSFGSYNANKIWTLCCSTSGRLKMIAVLTLVAAVAQSSLSNVIAYEAFVHPIESQVRLRLLAGTFVSDTTVSTANYPGKSIVSARQALNWAQEEASLNYLLVWRNSTKASDNGTYIAPNVTRECLDNLDDSITRLHDVPALQGIIDCKPRVVQSLTWTETAGSVRVILNQDSSKPDSGWASLVDSRFKNFHDGSDFGAQSLAILASDYNLTTIFVGAVMGSSVDPQRWLQGGLKPIISPFGEIQATAFNLTTTALNGTMKCNGVNRCMAIVFGLVCTLGQKRGLMDLERLSTGWTLQHASWSAEVSPFIFAEIFSASDPWFMNSGSVPLPTGMIDSSLSMLENSGCPITEQDISPCYYDFQELAYNFLYYSMEYQRIGYETGALGAGPERPSLFVSVMSTDGAQRYRMTYIPALLIAGLVSLFVAAIASATLTSLSLKSQSYSYKQFRIVDSLRLLVDCVAGLNHEVFLDEARRWTNQELERWAMQFMVQYREVESTGYGSGKTTVELSPVTTSAIVN